MASLARRRTGGGPGPVQWLALGGAVLVMLGLTFTLGLLVGRQWGRQSAPALMATAPEAGRKPPAPGRRGGIAAETMADRAPEPTEKLTFYQTLTEPLDGPDGPARTAPKPVAVKIPPATPSALAAAAEARASAPPAPPSLPPKAAGDRPAPPGKAAPRAEAQAPWTIQVGAYKNRRQADESREQLAGAGLDAYVVTLPAQEGVARYRVRVGTFRSREEAASAAERLRAQRSLATFVTPK